MGDMTIGEVARSAGLAPSALRYYERVGILPAPDRISGQRRYDSSVLGRLAVIDVAKQAGFTMNEIRTLLSGFPATTSPSKRWRELAARKLREVDESIRRAKAMKRLLEEGLRCGCLRLEHCDLLLARVKRPA